MTVIFGYKLKDYIKNDSIVINIINNGYEKANLQEEYKEYTLGEINISTIFITVKKVGEIYHGVKITIPKTVNTKEFKNRMHEISKELNQKFEFSVKENNLEYELYIESEYVIIESIDKYADLDDSESISNLYTLYKNK